MVSDLRFWLGALILPALLAPAHAQQPASWPSKPIAVVMGGGDDSEITLYKDKLSPVLGQPIILDRRPGGGYTIAGSHVAKSAPDGHTLLFTSTTFVVQPAVRADLSYDILTDFAPVSLLSNVSVMLLAHVDFPPNNMKEYIAYAKANPGKILWGTSGVGGIQHLVGEWMHDLIGSPARFIHYKNGSAATLDMVAGRVHVQNRPVVGPQSFIKAGKLKGLGVIGPKRELTMPDLPTAQEAGIKIDQPNFLGITVAAGTPPAIINRLSTELARVVKLPDIRAKLEPLGNNQIGSTPEEFGKYLADNVATFKKLVKEKNINVNR